MTAVRTLETVLADYRESAVALKRTKSAQMAELVDEICDDVERAAEDYLVFLNEKEAALWSGKSADWLRHRFSMWQRMGHGKLREHGKRDRLYRRCVLPRSADLAAARADAVQTARAENA